MSALTPDAERTLGRLLAQVDDIFGDEAPGLARLLAPQHAGWKRAALAPLAPAEAAVAGAWLDLAAQGFRPALLEAVALDRDHLQFARRRHVALLAAWQRYVAAAQSVCPPLMLLRATLAFTSLLHAADADEPVGFGEFRAALAQALQAHPLVVVIGVQLHYSARHAGVPVLAPGDEGERALMARLRALLKPGDLFARLGADHYALALCALPDAGVVEAVATRLRAELSQPFAAGGLEVAALPRLGIALAPSHGRNADALMRFAQAAAQDGGEESGVVLFDPARHLSSLHHASIEVGLRAALEGNELALFYQPQMDLVNWRVDHVEALLRWPAHPTVSPALVVEVAERGGCLDALTRWVINTALRQRRQFALAGHDLGVGINLAPANLGDPELPDFVAAALATWDARPGQLTLEITEGTLIRDPEAVADNLARLRRLGVRLSIDDFGTGYASLAYLKRLPAVELKIDQMFVRGLLRDAQDRRIVRSVLDLAAHFGLEVVAEGVEDRATLDALAGLGCRRIQGYWLSPALEGEALLAWLRAGLARP